MSPPELRTWRKRLSLTQAEAAALLGVGLRAVQRWEGGERKIPGPIAKLAELLAA